MKNDLFLVRFSHFRINSYGFKIVKLSGNVQIFAGREKNVHLLIGRRKIKKIVRTHGNIGRYVEKLLLRLLLIVWKNYILSLIAVVGLLQIYPISIINSLNNSSIILQRKKNFPNWTLVVLKEGCQYWLKTVLFSVL